MEELKRLATLLAEEILDEPDVTCCVPYNPAEQILPAPGPSLELPGKPDLPPTISGPVNGINAVNGKNGQNGNNGQTEKKSQKKPWCSLPNPQIPVMKAELRGGIHYPKCDCVKRNGLQDSCMAYNCWVACNKEGCASTPWATCSLGQRQLEKYGALFNQCPTDKPPCEVCAEELASKQAFQRQKERRCALGGQPGFDDDCPPEETALVPVPN